MPPKTLTQEEQKRIEQLQLQIDWIREGFELDGRRLNDGAPWVYIQIPNWGECTEYRRKPSPKYVPWTAEDAAEFRGLWVRNNKTMRESVILAFHPGSNWPVRVDGDWISLTAMHSNFTKLDGTPCGKIKS